MRIQDEASSSPKEYRDREINIHTTPHTPPTPQGIIEKRIPIHIRMRRSIHEAFMDYCYKTKMTGGQFYEEAGILFMDINPPPMAKVHKIIIPDKGEVSLDDQIEEVILIDELQEVVKLLPPEKKLHVLHKKKLAKLLKRCQKLNQRGDTLEELMKEVISRLV